MRTTYKLMIRTRFVDTLFTRWKNQGWEPTCVKQNKIISIVYIDMRTDKNTDPTNLPGVLRVLQ
jgi:hypothetical protein